MVYLDVVYNHFGPQLNYLHSYAETFFTDRHTTGWGLRSTSRASTARS
jgi:maltooligosyltrehalose trehalohydrolase